MLYTTSVDDVTPCVRDTIEQKILTCLLGKKEQKTSRGNTGPKAQCCRCDLDNPFFKFSMYWTHSSVKFPCLMLDQDIP